MLRRVQRLHEFGFVMALVETAAAVAHLLARQGARDEHGLAGAGTFMDVGAADHAFGIVREIGDDADLESGVVRAGSFAHVRSRPRGIRRSGVVWLRSATLACGAVLLRARCR